MVRRLEELTRTVSEMKQQGLKVPQEMRAELEELDQIWTMARIFRKPIGSPGCVKVTVLCPTGCRPSL
jgi:hypothetical protein